MKRIPRHARLAPACDRARVPPPWLHVPSLGIGSTTEAWARDADASIGCQRRCMKQRILSSGTRRLVQARSGVYQPRARPKWEGCACFENSTRRAASEWPVPPSVDALLPRDVQLTGPLAVYQTAEMVVEAVTALAAAAAGV